MNSVIADWRPLSPSFKNPIKLGEVPSQHPVAVFQSYWKALCGDNIFALKSDINPADIFRVLPNVGIVKLVRDEEEFDLHLTLVGERIKEVANIQGKGSYRKDLFSDNELADRLFLYDFISQNPDPVYFKMQVPFEGRDFIEIIKGIFPFSSDGRVVDHVVLVIGRVSEKIPS